MSQANKEIMRRWFDEVWNQRCEAAIDEIFAPQGRGHHFPETGSVIAGPTAFKEIYRGFCNAFPDLRVTVEDVIGEGNHIAVRWVATMTHLGDGLGVPATGKNVSLPGSSFAIIEDGKMTEAWNYIDMGHLYKQLGASPA